MIYCIQSSGEDVPDAGWMPDNGTMIDVFSLLPPTGVCSCTQLQNSGNKPINAVSKYTLDKINAAAPTPTWLLPLYGAQQVEALCRVI